MATKKKTTKRQRPPRQVWILVDGYGDLSGTYLTHAAAMVERITDAPDPFLNDRVVGPYVLAERARER